MPVEFFPAHRSRPRRLPDLLDRGRSRRPVRSEDQLHLRRFLLGHRVDPRVEFSLGHRQIVNRGSALRTAVVGPSLQLDPL